MNKIFYLQKIHFTVALCFLKYYIIYVPPPHTHTHIYIYIYIYIYIKQVFKTAISGAKILIHITIVLAPERAVVKTYHL